MDYGRLGGGTMGAIVIWGRGTVSGVPPCTAGSVSSGRRPRTCPSRFGGSWRGTRSGRPDAPSRSRPVPGAGWGRRWCRGTGGWAGCPGRRRDHRRPILRHRVRRSPTATAEWARASSAWTAPRSGHSGALRPGAGRTPRRPGLRLRQGPRGRRSRRRRERQLRQPPLLQ
ncbi:hypothetical protein PENTCL1PPCAC_13015, partial [Pristionchus entomophagus]